MDELKTKLHFHPTGTTRVKNGDVTINTIQLDDPLLVEGFQDLALYEFQEVLAWPRFVKGSEEQTIVIPCEIFESLDGFIFNSSTDIIPHSRHLYSFGIDGILWVNIFSWSKLEPRDGFEIANSQNCKLTIINHAGVGIDESVRFLEINQRLRSIDLEAKILNYSVDSQFLSSIPPIIRPPNSQGVWELIFETKMRDTPAMTLEFEDEKFKMIDLGVTKKAFRTVSRKFQILDVTTNNLIVEFLPSYTLTLEAEL